MNCPAPPRPCAPRPVLWGALGLISAVLVTGAPLRAQGLPSARSPVKIPEPAVRISLGVPLSRVIISATGAFQVLDRMSHAPVAREPFQGEEIVLVTDRPPGKEIETVFRVQVASLQDRQKADRLRTRLNSRLREPVDVQPFPDRRTYRVRVGEKSTRPEASALAERVRRQAGDLVDEVWIINEPLPTDGSETLRLVDEKYVDTLLDPTGVWIVPAASSGRVIVEGKEYRGILEVFLGRAGQLTVVNHVPLEEYLRGVVPNELGPGQYPAMEALKAQAIAARTYLVRNLGQFGNDGYDICDSQRCQVYKGYLSEHSMTDDAIRQTRGEVLAYEGAPINAMYTAVCGGHTEDGALVFPEEKAPYLRGVACYPELEDARNGVWVLSTRRRAAGGSDPASAEAYRAAALHVLGMLPEEASDPSWSGTAAGTREIRSWTFRALRLIGKRPGRHDFKTEPIVTRADLARYWMQVFSWRERVDRLLSEQDVQGLLAYDDTEQIPQADRPAVAYLMREGWYRPRGDGRLWPQAVPTRGEVVSSLYEILDRYDSLGLDSARVLGRRGRSLDVRVNHQKERRSLARAPYFFRRANGQILPAAELSLRVGDRINIHSGRNGIDLLVLEDPLWGVSDDRFHPDFLWEARLERTEAERRVRKRVPNIGRLIDLLPLEYGASQRVARLKVVGSRSSTILTGFRIRMALGLKEDLFVMDRQYDKDGNVSVFVFSGKGWGHGVGMCQVGAYGMALRGKTYREILAHYYSGAQVTSAYAGRI